MTTPYTNFDPTHALPTASYRDPSWLATENDYIWRGDWVFAATEHALSQPGDQLPIMVGDQPVLLLRTHSGELAALSNLCAHRGTLLVEEPSNAKRIQCPYHAWTYDDSGRLLACPFARSGEIDKQAHSLQTYLVESWHGLVFVSMNREVESLATRFAAVESHVASHGLDELEQRSDLETTELWECNWKIAVTNAMESYHLFKIHPTTLEPITPTKGAYYITGSARATATGGTVEGAKDYLLISLPPGFVGVLTEGSFVWLAVQPMGTHRCTVRAGGAYAPVRDGSMLGHLADWFSRTAENYALPDFLSEDKAICERVQRGAVGDFRPGRLLPVERVVEDFGHYLNWQINDVEPPSVHSEQNV